MTTRSQKRRRKCSKDDTSASAMDSTAASASVVDSRPASAVDSRTASKNDGAASMLDSRPHTKEDASASALGSRPVYPFEFSVTSEEGINLYVDMNSSLVDWHKILENHMVLCQCSEENKSQSFREQLLYLGNSHERAHSSFGLKCGNRIKDSNSSFVSSPHSLNQKGDNRLRSHLDAENGPFVISAAAACSSGQEDSNCLEEHKKKPSSTSFTSGLISCTRPSKWESVDPNSFNVPQDKTASCSVESLNGDGPQTTPKNKKFYGEVSKTEKIKMEQKKKDVTQLCVSLEITTIGSELSEVCCLENNPASLPLLDDSSGNLMDVDHSMGTAAQELAKFSESESHNHLNILPAEDKVINSPVYETEASCKSGKIVSDGGHRRKVCRSQLDKASPQFSGRILRSALRPRRSQRLLSKVLTQ